MLEGPAKHALLACPFSSCGVRSPDAPKSPEGSQSSSRQPVVVRKVNLTASGSMDCRLGAQTVSRDCIDGIPTFAIFLKDNFVDVTSALD
jgi:hypothetical protein